MKVDPELLRRRAEAAAEAAALRYHEICDGRVYCTLYGELVHEPKDWPRLSDCERDPQRWRIPARADRIRLLFKWDIVEHGRVTASDNSVVTLSARSPVLHKTIVLTQNQPQSHPLATPEMELTVPALKHDDAAYNLYVDMETIQPGNCRRTSELQSVEL